MTHPTKDEYARDVQYFTPIRPQEDEQRAGRNAATWLMFFAALVVGIIIGWATMANTPAPMTVPGFEMCEGSC